MLTTEDRLIYLKYIARLKDSIAAMEKAIEFAYEHEIEFTEWLGLESDNKESA